ncbi:MAG: Cmr5 family CRISPR-associated protein [Bacillota bacterium]|nr:MAG: Cmr5 family CRISPR-associated protein [Bacillota bacterium]
MPTFLDQERAEHALKVVKGMKGNSVGDKFAKLTAGFTATLISNGLGQSVATLRAKQEPQYLALYEALQSWLCEGKPFMPVSNKELINHIVTADMRTYMQAQAEAISYVEWLKKFAAAYLKTPD